MAANKSEWFWQGSAAYLPQSPQSPDVQAGCRGLLLGVWPHPRNLKEDAIQASAIMRGSLFSSVSAAAFTP